MEYTLKSRIIVLAPCVMIIMALIGCAHSSNSSPFMEELPDVVEQNQVAKAVLSHQLQYWTLVDGEQLPLFCAAYDEPRVLFRLTYLSPQLIEAAIEYKAITEGLQSSRTAELREEVLRRLSQEQRIPFIFSVEANLGCEEGTEYSVKLALMEGLSLYNLKGASVHPIEYDRIFDVELTRDGVRRGYIFFPKTVKGADIVNLYNDASFTVRLDNVQFIPKEAYFEHVTANLAWNYNLVPLDFPLDELVRYEIPAESVLSPGDLISLIDMTLTLISWFIK